MKNHLDVYLNQSDNDIRDIWDGLADKSAWVKAAIREKWEREREQGGGFPEPPALTVEDVRRVLREELAGLQIAGALAPAASEVEEDGAAADKLLAMF